MIVEVQLTDSIDSMYEQLMAAYLKRYDKPTASDIERCDRRAKKVLTDLLTLYVSRLGTINM